MPIIAIDEWAAGHSGRPGGLGPFVSCRIREPQRERRLVCAKMLMDAKPEVRKRGYVVDAREGANATSGGSSDRLRNAWQVIPTGLPSTSAAMIVTPEQKRPIVRRSSSLLSAAGRERCASPGSLLATRRSSACIAQNH
jgi:hypothetical protein